MDKYEAFAKALFRAEEKLCQHYGVGSLREVDGAEYEFFQRYDGIRTMLDVISEGEIEAATKVDFGPKEFLPRSYYFKEKKNVNEEAPF